MGDGEKAFATHILLGNNVYSFLEFLTLYLVTFLCGWFIYRWVLFNCRSFPPGPIGLPIIGYVGVLIREPHKELLELSKKYGNIFSLYFGTWYTVVVTDYQIAKEIVCHPSALSRPEEVFGLIPGAGGFAGSNGLEWQEQRRFCMSTMRNLGMGKGVWDQMMQAAVVDFVEEIASWRGKPTSLGEPLSSSVCSNNTALLLGRRIQKSDNFELYNLIHKANVILSKNFGAGNLSVIMPWLPKCLIKYGIGEYRKDAQVLDQFFNSLRKEVERHIDSKEVEDEEDLIGRYLKEMEKQNATNKHHFFSVDNLVAHVLSLLFAGMDTTTSSVHWLFLLIAAYPKVQKRVQQEIDDVLGRDGQPTWDRRSQLPYTIAVILEMERFVTINRLFPPRVCSEDFECSGYTIPKGSRILVNSWAIMHDPKYWENPMEFKPERFIRNDGKDASKTPGVSTFSFGRRNCPGEGVALMTIYMYLSAVMQKFTVKPPPGRTIDLTEGPYGAVISPVEQEVCFVERQ